MKKITPTKPLTIKEAKKSPCLHCNSFQCCNLLTLTSYPLLTLTDLDRTAYYLNFDNIVALLSRNGECHIYYSKPCLFFNQEKKTCTVHNQEAQPAICVYYNPYNCFYKNVNDDKKQIQYGHIWLDHKRLNYLSELIGFDHTRNIVTMPAYEELVEKFNESVPYDNNAELTLTEKKEPVFVKNQEICNKCAGTCCKNLLFPQHKPSSVSSLDFYYYSLNFPGISYLIADDRWIMQLDVKCKYLDNNNKCTIINMNERPLTCRYVNPLQCSTHYEINRPDQIRVNHENFEKVKKEIKTNQNGEIVYIEPVEKIKETLSEKI